MFTLSKNPSRYKYLLLDQKIVGPRCKAIYSRVIMMRTKCYVCEQLLLRSYLSWLPITGQIGKPFASFALFESRHCDTQNFYVKLPGQIQQFLISMEFCTAASHTGALLLFPALRSDTLCYTASYCHIYLTRTLHHDKWC